ncbi:MAG TPA: winged helix-turn-helix domain-containing protein [Chloroflexia bacterium]|jgi:DNA-binding transcriptional ArsR family regulator
MTDPVHTVAEEFQPADKLTITSLETVKVLSDPLRLQVLEAMLNQPVTVKQLAAELKLPQTKLYYHMNMLEEHGLVRVVSTRVVSGIIEKMYWVTAYSITLDGTLFAAPGGKGISDEVNSLLQTMFDGVRIDLNKSVAAGLVDITGVSADEDSEPKHAILVRSLAHIPEDKVEELYRKMRALVEEFGSYESHDTEDHNPVHGLMVVMFPTTHKLPHKKSRKQCDNGAKAPT